MFALPHRLKAQGVLGMNERNARCISPNNRRRFYPNADNKIRTKVLAAAAGLPVPELYFAIRSVGEIKKIYRRLKSYDTFVIKPARGSGGEGVIVFTTTPEGEFANTNGKVLPEAEIRMHIANILHGLYSLGGESDEAMVEYTINFDPCFADVTYKGVPDIRIIVFCGIPILAMLRLPTSDSGGRANLHQGAIGVGIDLLTGITRGGVQGSSKVANHPDTNNPIAGIQIPHWQSILEISAKAYDVSKLGYLGVDIALDAKRGPLILELNARPGLAVQIANGIGLGKRVEIAEKYRGIELTIEQRLDIIETF